MLWPRALLLLILPLLPAYGAEVPCPLGDSGRLVHTERPWNLGGGVDSDGCAYGVDAKGRRRILGLGLVSECARCSGVFLTRGLGGPLPAAPASPALKAEVKALSTKFRQERGLSAHLGEGAQLELAAELYLAVGSRLGLSEGQRRALAGRLYLRAAWVARGRAVFQGPDAGFRPRDLREVKKQLRLLEDRHDADPAAEPTVRALDRSLVDVEQTRRALAKQLQGATPLERFAQLEARLGLDRLEQELYARKRVRLAELLKEQPLGREELGLARVRAWIRAGDARSVKQGLAALGEDSAARFLGAAVAEEQRLLGLAHPELRAGGEAEEDPRRSGLLFFLAGDAARRCGQGSLSNALFEKARELAPRDEAGRRAALLLGS